MNESKSNAALDKLLSIYAKAKSATTRADFRSKIKKLRCKYRKKLKKIEDSKRSERGVDEVYAPTSWGLYSLQFINK